MKRNHESILQSLPLSLVAYPWKLHIEKINVSEIINKYVHIEHPFPNTHSKYFGKKKIPTPSSLFLVGVFKKVVTPP
mgnify:CR=1 FL=1